MAISQTSGRLGRLGDSAILPRDAWLFFCGYSLRIFAYGSLSVTLGLYLRALGLESGTIGAVFTAALAGGALMTVALTTVADRVGRRRVLVVGAVLMALAGAVFAATDNALVLAAAAVVGTISPAGKEIGPFLSVEQAALTQVTQARRRTGVFAAYNIVGSLSGATGALTVGLPVALGLEAMVGYRLTILGYVAIAVALALLFSRLSPAVEAPFRTPAGPLRVLGLSRSRGTVTRLAALFAFDSFSGGLVVQAMVAYWLHLRFDADTATLGIVFFGTNLCSALSFLAAAPLARRFGLINTMVFTHLPSHIFLMSVALMPNLELAVAALFARHLLSQLDVPTRQSYTMAIVQPDERSAAAGLISVGQNGAASVGPAISGAMLAATSFGFPFIVCGILKIIYDVALFATFRHVRPPEEQRGPVAAKAAEEG